MPESPSPSATQSLSRRLPAAALRVWAEPEGAGAGDFESRAAEVLAGREGVHELRPGRFVVLPIPGDAAVFDAALAWAREILGEPDEPAAAIRILLYPTVVVASEAGVEEITDTLAQDLENRRPVLDCPGVFLTTHASRMLELPAQFLRGGQYLGPSGKPIPMVLAGGARSDLPPWRNPELLGRRLKPCRRQGLEGPLDDLVRQPAGRIVGPLGCGKTRLLWERLAARSERFLWLRARPERCPRPSLGDQIVQQLLTPTPEQEADPRHPAGAAAEIVEEARQRFVAWQEGGDVEGEASMVAYLLERVGSEGDGAITLVVDEAERLGAADRDLLQALLGSPALGERMRIFLAGRDAGWPPMLAALPSVEVGYLDEAEMDELSARMVEGLSLPEAVRARFLDATLGNPLAFEEGLFGLLHERAFRRVYGSFFFGGNEATDYRPSLRLVRHLLAEAARLDANLPMLLLSLSELPAPAPDLIAASAVFGPVPDSSWERRALRAGILTQRESPWGPGLGIDVPAFRYALSFTVREGDKSRVLNVLGRLLADRTGDAGDSWLAYRLLAGTEGAVEPLLAAVSSAQARDVPREELLDALADELRRHRQRGGDPGIEMQLLWRLLPLARRLGRLQGFRSDLSRALELSAADPNRLLAIAGIKAELEHEAGDHAEAERTLRRALEAAQSSDQRRKALLLIQLGKILQRQGRFGEARRIFEALLRALEESGPSGLQATCRFFLGNIALQEGEFEEAREHHQAALDERLRLRLLRPAGSSYSALGSVSVARGNYPEALAYYRKAQELLEAHGREGEAGFALLGVGRALDRLGDFTGASKPLRQALAMREGKDDVAGEAIARLAVARNSLALGQTESALEDARKARFQLSLLSLEELMAETEHLLGQIRFTQRRYPEARTHFESALEMHRRRGDDLNAGFDHAWLLETAVAEEDGASVSRHAADLKQVLGHLRDVDLGEVLNFRLYRGLAWLSSHGHKVGDPTPYLERAYQKVLSKARHLEPDQRHRFLYQIPVNGEVVETATRRGLPAQPAGSG